jgi:hypothetical protein
MMKTFDVELKRPHSTKQRLMIEHPGSVVAFCGRRFGKTDAFVQRLYRMMAAKEGMYWWVGLSWRSASLKRAWRETTTIARGILRGLGLRERDYINRSRYEIRIPGLGEIWFRTADNPSSLAGEGIQGAVVDEFSLMSAEVWTEYLQGTLLDYGGWAAFAGVPKGVNWATMLYHSAADMPGWLQIHATSYDNPYIDHAMLEEVRASTPDTTFRQEYLAEILEDGAVFRKVKQAATAQKQGYAQDGHASYPRHAYVMGVDLARLHDYTCLCVIDSTTAEQVYFERFNKVSWAYQIERIKHVAELFGVRQIKIDQTGVGDPIVEQVQREITTAGVEGVQFSLPVKTALIESLMMAFDKEQLRICDEPILLAELQSMQSTRLSGGGIRYAAPDGFHDDCVCALALAWDCAKGGAAKARVVVRDKSRRMALVEERKVERLKYWQ